MDSQDDLDAREQRRRTKLSFDAAEALVRKTRSEMVAKLRQEREQQSH